MSSNGWHYDHGGQPVQSKSTPPASSSSLIQGIMGSSILQGVILSTIFPWLTHKYPKLTKMVALTPDRTGFHTFSDQLPSAALDVHDVSPHVIPDYPFFRWTSSR
jgi:hypothetical protein